MQSADLSGATPSNVAGQPAYTVRISPKHDGGLLGAAELAWDAAKGVPLRAAVYAQGNKTPVLELKAENISYGKVAASVFDVTPPAGAKVVNVDVPQGAGAGHAGAKDAEKPVTGVDAVSKALPFKLSAPDDAGRPAPPRGAPRRLEGQEGRGRDLRPGPRRHRGDRAAGRRAAKPQDANPKQHGDDHGGGLTLPKVSINGATGEELDTALATMIRFERGGVAYTVLGSVPPAAAQAAARGL